MTDLNTLAQAVDDALDALEAAAVAYTVATYAAAAAFKKGTDSGLLRASREHTVYSDAAHHVRVAAGGHHDLARLLGVTLNAPTPVAGRHGEG